MAQLTVDVSMTDAMSLSGMQQGSPSPRHAGVAAAAGQWEMARGNATASHACDASVQVLMQAREQATASNWFDPSLPVAVVGILLTKISRHEGHVRRAVTLFRVYFNAKTCVLLGTKLVELRYRRRRTSSCSVILRASTRRRSVKSMMRRPRWLQQ